MAFNSNPGKQQFTATAGQTVFTFNFAIFANTDIKVYKTLSGATANDITDLLTIATHYTVSINSTIGGTVTLLTGAGINDTITIARSLPITRSTDYVTNGDLYADTLDADQDYQTYLTNDASVQLLRAIIIPESLTGVSLKIPAPVANSYLRWNVTANALENDTAIPSAVVTTTNNVALTNADVVTSTAQAVIATNQAVIATAKAVEAAASAASINPSTVVATSTTAAVSKTTPVDADLIPLIDSDTSFGLKKLTFANLKTSLIPTIQANSNVNFTKPFQGAPIFTKASVSTITIPIGTSVKVGANIITVSGTAYTLSLNSVGVGALDTGTKASGTDYYVYALEAGGFILSANATNPTGYTTANSRQIGGFHYGVIPEAFTAINNIVAADATKIAGINAYSFWDLKFRASNGDNRGMFKANTGKWYDIYLLNTDHHLYGTSAAGKTIAGGTILNGRNYPKIAAFYGGDGTTTYGTLTWFEAAEIGKAYGKDMISYEEFAAIAYGVLEASSASTADTGVTQHLANYTSKFGMCMATGCQFIWGKDLIGPAGAAWNTNTEGRGSIYNASLVAAIFGGSRDDTTISGSRTSQWNDTVWYTYWALGCRYACDHLELA